MLAVTGTTPGSRRIKTVERSISEFDAVERLISTLGALSCGIVHAVVIGLRSPGNVRTSSALPCDVIRRDNTDMPSHDLRQERVVLYNDKCRGL